ncbi:hypothetical protein HKD37_09G024942 [Glycine soja]
MKVEHLFACHHTSEERKVPLATLSFQEYAFYWWTSLVRERRIDGDPPVEYLNELKSALRKRHIPSYYEIELMDKLQRLRQGSMSVEEYRQQMELLLLRVRLKEEERTSIARFLSGLNMEVRDKVSYPKKNQGQGILGAAPSKPKDGLGSFSSMDSFASWKMNGSTIEKEEREETPLQGEDESRRSSAP